MSDAAPSPSALIGHGTTSLPSEEGFGAVDGHIGFMAVMVFGEEMMAIWARMIHPEPGAPVLCVVTFILNVPGD